jgi:hypothetical protein
MPAPTLVSSSPTNGATNVAKNASIEVVFSTALDSSTVDERSIYLRYEPTREKIQVSVTLDSDGVTVVVVPVFLLVPNSAYKLVVIGADVSSTVRLESSTDDPLATTVQIAFQTGDSLAQDESTGVKTPTDQILEGEAVLPDDIAFRTNAVPLRLLRTSPKQHSFGIPITTSRIRLEFTSPIDISTVTGGLEVTAEAFYGEEDLLAILADLDGDGERHYFQYETGNYTGGDLPFLNPDLFLDPIFTYSVTGNFLDINMSPVTGSYLPNNLSIQVDINHAIENLSGVELGEDLIFFTCTEPYPKWDSIMGVRHEIGSFASADSPDDFVGLRIWRAAIDLWLQLWQDINLVTPSRYHTMWARLRAALDVWDDLMVAKYLNSGVVKELGDLRIQYNTGSGGAKSRKVRELEERLAKLYRNIWGYYTQRPAIGIKSEWDNYEPSRDFFRDRLWKLELAQNLGQAGLAGKIAANTAHNRKQNMGNGGHYIATWTES